MWSLWKGELSSRQADLESLLARQSSLKDRTSLATITLSLSETPVRKAAEKAGDPGLRGRPRGRLGRVRHDAALDRDGVGSGAPVRRRRGGARGAVAAVRTLPAPRRRASVPAVSGAGSLPTAPPVRGEGGKDA